MPFRLRIPAALHGAMLDQARREQPNECCGMLAGTVEPGFGNVRSRYPLINAEPKPDEFVADSRSLIEAIRAMRDRGEEVLAVYHSHPTSPPVPSIRDMTRRYSDETVCLIISLSTEPPLVRCWWLTETTYREADWEIV